MDGELGNVLTALGAPPDFAYTGADPRTRLDFIHRTTDDQEIYFVANRFARQGIDDYFYRYVPRPYDRFEQVECRFRVTGRAPQFWNPLTGEIEPVRYYCERDGYTCIPMHFAPEGLAFCGLFRRMCRPSATSSGRTAARSRSSRRSPSCPVTRRSGSPMTAGRSAPTCTSRANIRFIGPTAAFRMSSRSGFPPRRNSPARGPCASIRRGGPPGPARVLDSLRSWTEFDDPQIRYYSGTATYEKEFTMDRAQLRGRKVLLDLGNVQEVAVIRLNGHEFPVSWSDPCEADITCWVRPGTNRLSVDVVNLWPNRPSATANCRPGSAARGAMSRSTTPRDARATCAFRLASARVHQMLRAGENRRSK